MTANFSSVPTPFSPRTSHIGRRPCFVPRSGSQICQADSQVWTFKLIPNLAGRESHDSWRSVLAWFESWGTFSKCCCVTSLGTAHGIRYCDRRKSGSNAASRSVFSVDLHRSRSVRWADSIPVCRETRRSHSSADSERCWLLAIITVCTVGRFEAALSESGAKGPRKPTLAASAFTPAVPVRDNSLRLSWGLCLCADRQLVFFRLELSLPTSWQGLSRRLIRTLSDFA